jgi:hypothetical protein
MGLVLAYDLGRWQTYNQNWYHDAASISEQRVFKKTLEDLVTFVQYLRTLIKGFFYVCDA